jgi:hypothetical protein
VLCVDQVSRAKRRVSKEGGPVSNKHFTSSITL